MYTRYTALKSFQLGYGSTVRAPTPDRYKTVTPGDEVLHESTAPNGNVWFLDPDGERGKIECGEVGNLIREGSIEQTIKSDIANQHH